MQFDFKKTLIDKFKGEIVETYPAKGTPIKQAISTNQLPMSAIESSTENIKKKRK